MASDQPPAKTTEAGLPSKFWGELSSLHDRQLTEFGIENFKRHQAFRYFNWRWEWRRLHRSRQFRFLLAHTTFGGLWCAATQKNRGCFERNSKIDERGLGRLYIFATRLLWQYAKSVDSLKLTNLAEPEQGNPVPVCYRGRLISQDLANSAIEAQSIHRLVGTPPGEILEIGAGYGRTAYVLLNLFPEAAYTIIDIEPALTISKWYLSQIFPNRAIEFLTPKQALSERIRAGGFDLAISISSLQEMTAQQLNEYLVFIDQAVGAGAVYLKQREAWTNPVDGVTLRVSDYPIPARWVQIFRQQARVQTDFTEAGWRLGRPE